ncbi:MAG: class I SAM-dependent methyltransferase [Thermoplasmatota archaeon]
MNAPALRVPRHDGERVRRALLDAGLLRLDLKVRVAGDEVLLPLARDVPDFEGRRATTAEFEAQKTPPPAWQQVVRGIPEALVAELPSSFDVIGDVVLFKVPRSLEAHAREIADAMLATIPNARCIALDHGVEGELRVRRLEVLAGSERSETVHVENGVRLRVDPATCYFSPRLATERKRVADLVAPGERVLDLFAGVGPFAIVIARHAKPARVDAVDLNAEAVRYMRENIVVNKVDGVVFAHEGDARVLAGEYAGASERFDRVITNLPHGAHAFLEAVMPLVKSGGTWHYHCIQSEDDLARHLGELGARSRAMGRELSVTARREVRTYSPSERHFAVDFAVA